MPKRLVFEYTGGIYLRIVVCGGTPGAYSCTSVQHAWQGVTTDREFSFLLESSMPDGDLFFGSIPTFVLTF